MYEKQLDADLILASKTDIHGVITYCSSHFIDVAGYSEEELLGKPHSIVRHEKMPKIIFKLLWEQIKLGKEINAYVINRCKNGDFYWVFANVTPSFDARNTIIGFHSTRRKPSQTALQSIKPLYETLRTIEAKEGVESAHKHITNLLAKKGVSYDEFIVSI